MSKLLAPRLHIWPPVRPLSAVLAASSTAYALVRGIGASYLVWLSAQMLWNSRRGGDPPQPDAPARRGLMTLRRAYLLGPLSNLTNPKALLFFVVLSGVALVLLGVRLALEHF